jgi:two-component system LytT family response regulator
MNAILVDDEAPAREELRRLLAAFDDVTIVGDCANAIEGIAAINRLSPDVVFLDVQMPRVTGLEMLTMLDPERKPKVVFLTAHEDYALKAFEENAFDYLLKPVSPERLAKTIERLRHASLPASMPFDSGQKLAQIPCSGQHRIYLVKVAEIEYVISKASGVSVILHGGLERVTELTLKTLEARTSLIRCHRQVLVNPDDIREIVFQPSGHAEIVTFGDQKIPISRRFLGPLKARLGIA